MKVQPRTDFQRVKAAGSQNQAAKPSTPAQVVTFPAPRRGWVLNENIATPEPGGAARLDNWICTPTGVRMRNGSRRIATIANNAPVVSMLPFVAASGPKLFAATTTAIYDVTNPASTTTIPTPVVTSQTSGYYVTATFETAGGYFLIACNGTNAVRSFDGTTWDTPTITGVTSSTLSAVWSYASRLFFVQRGTLNVWFLPVDSIAGAAQSLSLSGLFRRGGAVLFGGTWSADSGEGLDDRCVIVSDQGEVAVFEGQNPGDANNWLCVGVYDIGKPLGPRAHFQAGGDMVIATENGLIPLTEAVQKDPAALTMAAVTRTIHPEWSREVAARRSLPWEVAKWTAGNLIAVSLPRPSSGLSRICYTASSETGAWSRQVGWDTRCLAVHNDRLYFGTNAGTIHVADVGGSDDGTVYTASLVYNFDPVGAAAATKTIHQVRAIFQSKAEFIARVGSFVDYENALPANPAALAVPVGALWDVSSWDVGLWDAAGTSRVTANWVSVGRTGFVLAPRIQISSGDISAPEIELYSVDVTLTVGGVVT